jgi:nitroreductase
MFSLLAEGNKSWAKNSALLVVVISRKNFEFNEKPARTHQFDAGSAWENLALEAFSRGLVAHGMQGFNYDKARIDLIIPDDFEVMAMIAIGKKGSGKPSP